VRLLLREFRPQAALVRKGDAWLLLGFIAHVYGPGNSNQTRGDFIGMQANGVSVTSKVNEHRSTSIVINATFVAKDNAGSNMSS
jgi:hypothetical protein